MTDVPVVLLSAPAGYGKTTLLALWRHRDERPFAWVSLEAADNDPVALIAAVIAALDPILELDPALSDHLSGPKPPTEDVVLPSLVDACAAGELTFVLVLDDLHFVTERSCHKAIGYLAERLPPGCRVALGTRTDPRLPLGSWRAHGRLAELRAAELSLADVEAHAVLAAAGVHGSRSRATSARCRSTTASTTAAATGEPKPTSTSATSTCRPPRCSPSATA